MNKTLRSIQLFTAISVLLGCGAGSFTELQLPEPGEPPTPSRLEGEWLLRKSLAVKSDNPVVKRGYVIHPDSANRQTFGPNGKFSDSGSRAGRGTYAISGDSILVVMADNDSTLWTGVRVSHRWLLQKTAQGAIDFDGDGQTEWAEITYLYERAKRQPPSNSR